MSLKLTERRMTTAFAANVISPLEFRGERAKFFNFQ